MKPFLILSVVIGLCFCATPTEPNLKIGSQNTESNTDNSSLILKDYDSLKLDIAAQKKHFLNSYNSGKKAILEAAGIYLDSMICEQFFPHWLGTEWDFNGHTNEPKTGQIACGYLVSTLLKHADFKINRYKLAQQSSFNEIKTLAAPKAPLFLGSDYQTALSKIKELKDGLYILGLSYHVGLIRINENEVRFLHSTYLAPTAVVNELAANSEAFKSSDVYYIGEISGNKELMKKWLKSTSISIFFD